MVKIIFTPDKKIEQEYYPKPAKFFIPEWYQKMESYFTGKKEIGPGGQNPGTIKKCIPVFDAITAGYIITLPTDVYVKQVDGVPYYSWASLGMMEFHPVEQAPTHPNRNGHQVTYPKWVNPWVIQTPKGYSTMFTQPMHRESVFTILPGIVDTDTYPTTVNFPFVLNDITFEGMIPAGTPIAQVIPIKRDSWKMEIGGQKELKVSQDTTIRLMSKFFNRYKTLFWNKKEYN